jgi:hypothetical protein
MKPEKSGKDVKKLISVVKRKFEVPEPDKLKKIHYMQIEERLSGL